MKTIRFKTDGQYRYFTPATSARRCDETEEAFLNRCARKVIPEGNEFDILENALYSGFIPAQEEQQTRSSTGWKKRLARLFS